MPCEVLLTGEIIEGWFPILTGKGKQNGELSFSVQYIPLSGRPKSYEVRHSKMNQFRTYTTIASVANCKIYSDLLYLFVLLFVSYIIEYINNNKTLVIFDKCTYCVLIPNT